jgi:hypothetical protein
VLQYTANNVVGCVSVYQTVGTTQVSCIDHRIFGGQFLNENVTNAATADVISIEQSDSVKIFGPWMYCGSGTSPYASGRSLIYVDMRNAGSSYCTLNSITGENNTYMQKYGVYFSNNPELCGYWTIDNCKLATLSGGGGYAIYGANTGATLSYFDIRKTSEVALNGIHFSGIFQNSSINDGFIKTDFGAVENCFFAVDTSKSAEPTTKTNLAIMECGSINRTWAAGVSGVTGTYTAGYVCAFVGQQFTFNITWHTTSGITSAAGAYVSLNTAAGGLTATGTATTPIPVVNATAGTLIGYGFVDGAYLYLPAFTVTGTANILISGSYYVS